MWNVTEKLAGWLGSDIARMLRSGGPRRWQWDITILAWACDKAGVAQVYIQDPGRAAELLHEAGISAAALRQGPFDI